MTQAAPRDFVLLALLAVVSMGVIATHEFVDWDDPTTIAKNPDFDPPTLSKIARYWREPAEALYAPLTYTAWGAIATIAHVDQPDECGSKLNPWMFHAASIGVHIAATLLLFATLVNITTHRGAAWIGAAVFGVHPIQVETVAWASGLKDALCGLFIILALWAFVRYRAEQRRDVRLYACAICAALLACLSKPTGIVTPLVLFIVDRVHFKTRIPKSLMSLAPAILISIVFAVIAARAQPLVSAYIAPVAQRPLIALDSLGFYAWKLIWPSRLTIDYGRLPDMVIARGWLGSLAEIPILIGVAIFVVRRRAPLVVAGSVIAVTCLLPVLGFMPFTFQQYSSVADHYLYPAMIGVALLVCGLFIAMEKHRNAFARAATLLLAIFAITSIITARHWRDSSTLFAHTLDVNPRSFLALTGRSIVESRRGEKDRAIQSARAAINANPNYAFAHFSLANHLRERGDLVGATEHYREVFRIYTSQRNYDPKLAAGAEAVVATMLLRQNQLREAVELYEDASRRDPTNELIAQQLAATRARLATTLPATR